MSEGEMKLNLNLSSVLTRNIEKELADHIACADEKAEAMPFSKGYTSNADSIRERLSLASTLRKLSAPHIVDQVSHTLWRKPTRAEWKEFGWLLFWFALVYASDLIAASRDFHGYYDTGLGVYTFFNDLAKTPQNLGLLNQTVFAWFLSAVARAGFFVQFGLTFVHAYRSGLGVMIARLIQLKLLHTILVTVGFGLLPYNPIEAPLIWEWKSGAFTHSWIVLISLTVAVIALAVLHFRKHGSGQPVEHVKAVSRFLCRSFVLPAMWFLALMLVFLYQGAPSPVSSVKFDSTARDMDSNDTELLNYYHVLTHSPRFTYLESDYLSNDRTFERIANKRSAHNLETVDSWWSMPFVKAGAGLGWLAFPIPLMGILSLLAMWWILGRRSVWDALLYGAIVFYAFWGTVGPFLLGSNVPLASAHEFLCGSPTPCFDAIFQAGLIPGTYHTFENFLRIVREDYLSITFAFYFSAMLPWLMVGLFARTKAGSREKTTVAAE